MDVTAFSFVLESLADMKYCVRKMFVSIFKLISQSLHSTPYFDNKGIKPNILESFLIKIQSSFIIYSLFNFKYGFATIHFVYS